MKTGVPTVVEHGNLFAQAKQCLIGCDVAEKLRLTQETAARFAAGELVIEDDHVPVAPLLTPGRPERPRLVAPRDLPQRSLSTPEGRAALVHAVAHIEFNAINLAWDAVHRFRGMPDDFYRDWIGVAADEARHFALLAARLHELGCAYGDFDAHDGLWEMAVKTSDSCLARMALVPRVLEARGLDVTPGMIARLRAVGDAATAEILEVILREEVAHVAAGSRWFAWCCAREGLEPESTFADLVRRYARGALKGPFNEPARLQAGFTVAELAQFRAGFAA
ncbi:MAG TPA: ferritin-like domain-containing protein [Rudaea sp.]